MTADRWAAIERLYHAAAARPAEDRDAFLAASCGDDRELGAEVSSLLDAPDEAVAFLEGQPPSTAAQAPSLGKLATGSLVGPYRIESELGAGGMGTVFRATDQRLHRTVAIKGLSAALSSDAMFRTRFLEEARAVSALSHPNIVVLYDIATHEGADFLVLEHVRGITLSQIIGTGRLDVSDVCSYGAQTARALAAAHQASIVHRDIKPSNIMVTPEGLVKILDFGIAKRIGAITEERAHAGLTSPGHMIGTVVHVARADARRAAGRAVRHLLPWCRPLPCLDRASTFRSGQCSGRDSCDRDGDPGSSQPAEPCVPTELDAILRHALEKDPDLRYGSAGELADALDQIWRPPGRPTQVKRPQAPFAGRLAELDRLRRAWTLARQGSGGVILICGEPGIGKSALLGRFLEEAAAAANPFLAGRGACVEQHGVGEAYLPFLQALQQLLSGPRQDRILALFRRFAPTWCIQFSSLFSSTTVDQFQREAIGSTRERMLRELGDVLTELTVTTPVVLALEDLHWADSATIDLLRYLGQRATSHHFLLLGTERPQENASEYRLLRNCKRELTAQSACEEIRLDALPEEDIGSYLTQHFEPNRFPPELGMLIYRQTEGHPLFITGVLQLLAERGDVVRRDGEWVLTKPVREVEIGVPNSVRSMIDKRLDSLNEEDRQMLQYASVQGVDFSSTVLGDAAPGDELTLEESLDRVQRAHRLIQRLGQEDLPAGDVAIRYRFAHALYRDTLYETLLPKRRIALHQRTGESLERLYSNEKARVASALSVHFERARRYEKAIEYLEMAGENAKSIFVHSQAIEFYAHALDLAERIAEPERTACRIRLLQKRGDAWLTLGSPLDAEQTIAPR